MSATAPPTEPPAPKAASASRHPLTRSTRGRSRALILAFLCWGAAQGFGQSTVWTATGAGNFVSAPNWSNGVPNSSTSASITDGTSGTPTSVALSGANASVLDLVVAANNTLSLSLTSNLSIFGTGIAIDGALNITGGSGNNGYLQLDNNVTLTGAGLLALSYGDHNGNAFIEEAGGSYTLTNSGGTILGNGVVGNGGLALVNTAGGVVNANVSGQSLTLNGTGGITNTALLEASAGGILVISSSVSNSGGTISAAGGTVDLGGTVTGGNLSSVGGLLQTLGSATLVNVTITPSTTYTGGLGTTTFASGTITNDGAFQFNAGSGNNTNLTLNSNTTLAGGGTLTLNSGDTNGFVYINEGSGGVTLSNVDNSIQGYGFLGNGALAVVNQSLGTLNANVSGRTLTLDGTGGITNSGLIEATNGGTLHVSTLVDNLGGNITASGGTVNLSSKVEGGTLNTALGGTFQTSGSSTLDGTTQGILTLSTGSMFTGAPNTNTQVNGTIANFGTFVLFSGSGANTYLSLVADTTLMGGGTVTLSSGDNNGQSYIESGSNNALSNVDNTIDGYGILGNSGITLVNESGGTVDANAAGLTLHLNGGAIQNTGLLEATGNGILQITGTTVSNAGANITANGGTVLVDGTTIEGGTLNQSNGGLLRTNVSATLDGTTLGVITLSPGTTYTGSPNTNTNLLGTFANMGTVSLFAGGGTNTFLNIDSGVTLQGGGAVMLNSGDNNGQSYIQSGNNYTLANFNDTIEGYGDVGHSGMVLANGSAGVVNANIAGQTLLLDGGSITNAGLLEGTANGTLRIATLVNNSGSITANGGNVLLATGTTVQGGTLTTANGGVMLVNSSSTVNLDGTSNAVTISTGSILSAAFGSLTNISGTIANDGVLQLAAGSGNNTFLGVVSGATFQGGGTLTLNSGDNNGQSYVYSPDGSTLANVDDVIQGYGHVGHGTLALFNESGGTVDANSSGNSLVLDGSGNVTNAGSLEATGGGTLVINNTVVNTTGNVSSIGGTVNVAGGTIEGGTLNGSSLETTSAATLDGATNGILSLSAGTQFTANRGTTITVLGTIANQGNIQVNAGSGNNTGFNLSSNLTLQGGGTVTLNSGDNNGQSFIQEAIGGITLTNSGDIIQGYGVIGNGALSFLNDVTGTVLANIPGQTLVINSSGAVTNNGTFEADGGTLSLVSQPTNLAGNTLTGGTWTASNAGNLAFGGTVDAIVTNDATLVLDAPSSVIETKTGAGNSYQQVDQTLATNNGALKVLGGRSFSATNAITNNGLVELGGGTFTAPGLVNNSGATLAGFGTFSPSGGVTIANGAQLSPGDSAPGQRIATLAFGTTTTLGPGGSLAFDLKNAPSAVAGTDYDTLDVSGTLAVSATPGSPFSIAVRSVDPGTGGSGLANFNPLVPYSWTLASAGTISGFSAVDFSIDSSGFQNSLGGGAFTVSESGNLLMLNFTPVPEPETWLLMLGGIGAVGAIILGRRSRRPAQP